MINCPVGIYYLLSVICYSSFGGRTRINGTTVTTCPRPAPLFPVTYLCVEGFEPGAENPRAGPAFSRDCHASRSREFPFDPGHLLAGFAHAFQGRTGGVCRAVAALARRGAGDAAELPLGSQALRALRPREPGRRSECYDRASAFDQRNS